MVGLIGDGKEKRRNQIRCLNPDHTHKYIDHYSTGNLFFNWRALYSMPSVRAKRRMATI